MIIEPKTRGFICTTAHPDGCAANVREQIDYVKSQPAMANPPKNVLVIGSSTGYGLSSRIVPAFAGGASTVGVFFEKPPTERKTASAGWYNTAAFEEEAEKAGVYAKSFNGDAFSNEIKDQVIATIKADLGKIDTVVYSLASPRRTDPTDGETYKSVLKPIGEPYTQKNLNTESGVVDEITIEPCTEEEIAHTVKVMGGEDWELWVQALLARGLLAPGCITTNYTYLGSEVTWPIYHHGTIGKAKEDLDRAQSALVDPMASVGGKAYVVVMKGLVTQAASAIPGMSIYLSLLFRAMKKAGTHEGCIEQTTRFFTTQLYGSGEHRTDEGGRIRMDELELRDDIQQFVADSWPLVSAETLDDITDFDGYKQAYLEMHGFEVAGMDYEVEVDPDVSIELQVG